jgi:predicted HTH domain antitoxin
MPKTISVADLGHGQASRAVRAAQEEPVLVSKENRPAAWLLSAENLARVVAARGDATADAYQRALELIAVELYRDATLTLGQGAKLAGMALGDFIDLCARLDVPILWESEAGLDADVRAAATMAGDSHSGS